MDIKFSPEAWEQYLYWQGQDKRTIKRINDLLRDIVRGNPFEGIGKPESLKENFSGFWSRRIDDQNRLVYCVDGNDCQIAQCKGHYDS